MPAPDLSGIIRPYAVLGVKQWSGADRNLRDRARKLLANRIAEQRSAMDFMLSAVLGNQQVELNFIPMPVCPEGQGFERSFFAPIAEHNGGALRLSFEFFVLVKEDKCMAFRFELAHPETTHDYAHVQLNRRLLHKGLSIDPDWIPDAYPAFPTSARNSLELFLCMAVAAHGWTKGFTKLLEDVFPGKAFSARQYAEKTREVVRAS